MSARTGSFDGYVLPHLVDVTVGTPARVKNVLVSPHEILRSGDIVAGVERLFPGRDREWRPVSIQAPVPGIVTRCWAMEGDVVGSTWPILSVASAESVLVVAHCPAEHATRIRNGEAATIIVAGEAFPGRVVSVSGIAEVSATQTSTRVVLSFPDPPSNALWPGTPVQIEIAT